MPKKKDYAHKDYDTGTSKIIAAAKAGASKEEIRAMVQAHNKSTIGKKYKKGSMSNSQIDARKMWSYMPKSTETKAEKTEAEKTEKPVVAPATLQEKRDHFYNKDEYADKGYFQDTPALGEEREAVLAEAKKSGYMRDLQTAVEDKYGKSYHDISDPVDKQMAGDAMIDEEGNILPMSSASGQYSGSALPKKAPRGFKMPGWGNKK